MGRTNPGLGLTFIMFRHRPIPEALIFDMDGLLLDTERVDRDAFVAACREVGWQSPDMTVYADCIGTTGPTIETILRKGYGPEFPWEAVRTIWRQRYLDQMESRPADVKPGVVETLHDVLDALRAATEKHFPRGTSIA